MILTKLQTLLPITQLATITRSILYGEKLNFKYLRKLPTIKFIRGGCSNSEPASSYNYDQTKNFFISQYLTYVSENKVTLTRSVSTSVYGWIDKIIVNWSIYRILLANYRFSIRKAMQMPYSDIMPIVTNDFVVLLLNIQPVTYEDCKYYREYTELFVVKLTRLFIRGNTTWQNKLGSN